MSLFFASLIVLFGSSIFVHKVNAQTKGPIGCEELKSILKSKECPAYVIKIDNGSLWCAQSYDQLIVAPEEGNIIELYRGRTPDYILDVSLGTNEGLESCYGETSEGKNEVGQPQKTEEPTQPQQPQANQTPKGETKSPAQAMNDWIIETLGVYESQVGFEDVPEEGWRTPTITTKDEQEAWAFLKSKEESDIAVVKGQGQLQPLGSGLVRVWGFDAPTQKFTLYENPNFSSATSDSVQLRYTLPPDSGAVIDVSPLAEIKFLEPSQDKQTQDLKRMIKLNKGEIEVKVKNANSKEKFGVQTDFFDLIVIQTHFWVSHDPDKKHTVIGVYEGQVEVTPRGSNKPILISPNGDKPGIVVITQKLSVIKLAVAGLVIVVVLVGVILFVRKRFALKGRGKKK